MFLARALLDAGCGDRPPARRVGSQRVIPIAAGSQFSSKQTEWKPAGLLPERVAVPVSAVFDPGGQRARRDDSCATAQLQPLQAQGKRNTPAQPLNTLKHVFIVGQCHAPAPPPGCNLTHDRLCTSVMQLRQTLTSKVLTYHVSVTVVKVGAPSTCTAKYVFMMLSL